MTATLERPGAPLRLNAPTLALALGPLGHRARDLTPRETEILTLLAHGHTAAGAARRLDSSADAVKAHLYRALRALGASNSAHGVALAHHRGLLHAEPGPAVALTPRRAQILDLAAGGLTNPQIAREMYLVPNTVKWHLGKLMADFSAVNRPNLVHRGFGCGALGVTRHGGDAR